MEAAVLVIHLILALVMIGVILLQKSEGGALGIGGGGGGMGGFMTGRGAANVLTRTTVFIAAAFFVTSITLTILARSGVQDDGSVISDDPQSGGSVIPMPSVPEDTGPVEPTVPAPE